MKKSLQKKLSFSLTLVVILIMAAVYFLQIRKVPEEIPDDDIPSTSVTLIHREENEVAEVVFYNANGESTCATPYIDNGGFIRWAYSGAADYILVPYLVHDKARSAWIITAIDTAHKDSADLQLTDFGLSPPVLTIESRFYDGSSHTLKLGSQTTDLQYYFLMIDDDPAIYLINAVLGERMQYGTEDMLDMSVPGLDIQQAEYIRVAERGRDEIVLGLRDENAPSLQLEGLQEVGGEQLIMHEPLPGMNISHSRLIEYIILPMSQLRLTALEALEPLDLAPFGLDEPALEFEFRTVQVEIHWLFGDIFSQGDNDFAYVQIAGRPHVFITPAENVEALLGVDALNIAERFLALVSINDVESITIAASATITGQESNYRMVMNHIAGTFEIEPTLNGIPVDDNAFRRMFTRIISLIADAEIEPFIPEDVPELIITHHRIGNPDTQIRFFNYNANFLAVSIDGGEAIFVTNRRAVGRLFDYLDELVSL